MKAAAFTGLGLVVLVLLFGVACVRGLRQPTPEVNEPRAPPPVSRTFEVQGAPVTVHALHTGWVSVKEAHRTLGGPDATRVLSILTDARWTEWMPVYAFAIVHPEGVWLVDAGLSEATLDFSSACDPGNEFVYQNLLRFRFEPSQRVDRQLMALGVPLERVRGVVFTHRHADHTDAFNDLGAMLTLDDGRAVLFAGDATFSVEQVSRGTIAGISEVPDRARRSLSLIAAQVDSQPTFLLPAHDPASLRRFVSNEKTVLLR